MISYSIQALDSHRCDLSVRPGRAVRRARMGSLPRLMTIAREKRAPGSGEAEERTLSIEERICRYLDSQPAQLYRGGA
ncbi:hypothetical protein G3480_11710 [Thiorhodococcus mannitoliphagus]|uniref:Uncharacterized protein n=1 Tax=Thiorhodococcus mannitoliphagus TaxID=329406 RepID=A0A6P1DT19_9GAMM|nr:hypothetical protein [Thiorhodococcus mannitoliphagus]